MGLKFTGFVVGVFVIGMVGYFTDGPIILTVFASGVFGHFYVDIYDTWFS